MARVYCNSSSSIYELLYVLSIDTFCLTLAHSKAHGQNHARFDYEYLRNGDTEQR